MLSGPTKHFLWRVGGLTRARSIPLFYPPDPPPNCFQATLSNLEEPTRCTCALSILSGHLHCSFDGCQCSDGDLLHRLSNGKFACSEHACQVCSERVAGHGDRGGVAPGAYCILCVCPVCNIDCKEHFLGNSKACKKCQINAINGRVDKGFDDLQEREQLCQWNDVKNVQQTYLKLSKTTQSSLVHAKFLHQLKGQLKLSGLNLDLDTRNALADQFNLEFAAVTGDASTQTSENLTCMLALPVHGAVIMTG